MYNFPYYKEEDRQKVIDFMKQHPFVTIIGTDAKGRIEASQLPVLIDERGGKVYITGHVSRKMSHEKAFTENPAVLLIFTGAHTYVSGTYYSGNPQQASTWNYISIHARGEIKWMDENGLIELLKKLSLHFENNNTSSSTIYENLPPEYTSKLLKAIVGFEMEVTELENVHKLSQNRDEKSYDNIIKELKQQEGDAKVIGEIMEERKSKVFPS
jgi:transcriptional regulator